MLSTLIPGRRYGDNVKHVDIWKEIRDNVKHVDIWKETAITLSTLTSGYGDNVKHVDIWKEIRR